MKIIAALAVVVLLPAGAARADESFDGFRNFCVANKGMPAPALAAADAAGWMVVPPQALAQLPQSDFQDPQGRMRTLAGGTALLLTARGTTAQAGAVRICAIGVIPAGASDLAGQLQAFAGVPKQTVPSLPEGMYAWRDENGTRVSLDHDAPDFHTQITSGTGLIATTRTAPQMTMILLMSAVP